jgi:transmembrane sensor
MDTTRIIELLARKMAGEATAAELEELTKLISRYPDAVYYEEILKEVWETAAGNADEEPDTNQAYLLHQLKYYHDFPAETENAPSYDFSENFVGLTVVLLILLVTGFTWWNMKDKSGHDVQIIAGKGIRKKFILPDSTLVWLNAGSRLSYCTNFNGEHTRKVSLSGEAFFDVKHQAGKPFIVHTEKISVKVLGTAFNVQAYPEDRASETTLLRGSIELSVNGSSDQKVILSPSEKFRFSEDPQRQRKNIRQGARKNLIMINPVRPVIIGRSAYIEETSWKDNRLVFKNESLRELKPKLERWFNVRINMESTISGSYRFTGVFTNETITEALTAMQLIKPFTFKLNANDLTIY